jgi:hypothetical protein
MRWPRARFTVRRMMVAVAVIAVLLCVESRRRRRAIEQERERCSDACGDLPYLCPWLPRGIREAVVGRLRDSSWPGLRDDAGPASEVGAVLRGARVQVRARHFAPLGARSAGPSAARERHTRWRLLRVESLADGVWGHQ